MGWEGGTIMDQKGRFIGEYLIILRHTMESDSVS
jgi:hypothetical protein